jgi:hypothetical protein
VFDKADCLFFGYKIIYKFLAAAKKAIKHPSFDKNKKSIVESFLCDSRQVPKVYKECASDFNISAFVQNAFDLLRMMTLPEEDEIFLYLVDRTKVKRDEDVSSEDSGDSENEQEEEEEILKKSPKTTPSSTKKRKTTAMSTSEKLQHLSCYRRQFERVWLLLLSLPLTGAQHKLVLKHLPTHVIPALPRPLLVADYLTRSYEEGGFIAVLALGIGFITFIIEA